MTKAELREQLCVEEDCTFGSSQMIKFGMGVMYAMYGYEIPDDLYPLPTSKYLGEQYRGADAPAWMVRLWASTAMIQLHQTDLQVFGTEFSTWFSEKKLHATVENLCSVVFVMNGVVWGNPTRCTQCGKLMEPNTICVPCWNIHAPLFGLDTWTKHKRLKIDRGSIWDKFQVP